MVTARHNTRNGASSSRLASATSTPSPRTGNRAKYEIEYAYIAHIGVWSWNSKLMNSGSKLVNRERALVIGGRDR